MPRLCGIGTGADSLRFQCLQGPILIHFVGHNTLHVIFDIHYVNYRQCAVVIAAVLKPAGIFIALAPCLCVPPLGTDTKAIAAFIKPKQHTSAAGLRHNNAIPRAGHPHGNGGLIRFIQIDKMPTFIVIAKLIAGTHRVFQICRLKRRGTPANTDFQNIVRQRRSGNRRCTEQCDDKKQG